MSDRLIDLKRLIDHCHDLACDQLELLEPYDPVYVAISAVVEVIHTDQQIVAELITGSSNNQLVADRLWNEYSNFPLLDKIESENEHEFSYETGSEYDVEGEHESEGEYEVASEGEYEAEIEHEREYEAENIEIDLDPVHIHSDGIRIRRRSHPQRQYQTELSFTIVDSDHDIYRTVFVNSDNYPNFFRVFLQSLRRHNLVPANTAIDADTATDADIASTEIPNSVDELRILARVLSTMNIQQINEIIWEPGPFSEMLHEIIDIAMDYENDHHEERQRDAGPLEDSVRRRIPFSFYKLLATQATDYQKSCAVCLENFKNADLVSMVPCQARHYFHQKCLRPWWQERSKCPLCQEDLNQV